MLRLYYSREDINKDRYLFARIEEEFLSSKPDGSQKKKVILLVPDQFTLQAERNAFEFLGVPGLIDVEVLSVSRLGFHVLGETGGGNRTFIDRYGRHMLLSRIISQEEENLNAFSGMKRFHSFIEMANDLITEMKQYNTTPELLHTVMETLAEDSLLRRKLEDIQIIYERYEEEMRGKYIDTEDYMELFVSRIKDSQLVKNAEFWVTGFDSFTPKSLLVLEQLILHALDVNVVMTCADSGEDKDVFDLPRKLMKRISWLGLKNGVEEESGEIGVEFRVAKVPELLHLEKQLFAYPYKQYTGKTEAIAFCRAANFYGEAETAAAHIVSLVRDKGLRYREIAVICNDLDGRGSIIKRIFNEYGIPFFMDKKRSVLHSPSVEYVLALMDIVISGWLYEDVFRLLKTNLADVPREQYELLENYAIKYRIWGNRWKSPFKYGASFEGEDGLRELNEIRKRFADPVSFFEKNFKKAKTAREKTEVLYRFLSERAELPRKTDTLISDLNSLEEYEAAEETAQIFAVIVEMLDQVVELLGESEVTEEEYVSMLKAGFEAVEIGLLPPTMDQVIVGTMQRTRTGRIKAMVVIGANDGILPAASSAEELLSEDEKAFLYSRDIEICKDENLRLQEEKLAIYRNLSKAEQSLFVSYSVSDLEGKETKPSAIFEKMRKLFPRSEAVKDVLNRESGLFRIETGRSTLKHLAEALREGSEAQRLAEEWKSAYNWFLRQRREEAGFRDVLRSIEQGIFFTNKLDRLERDLVTNLYKKNEWEDFVLSPSRLERFGRCPFSHFIQYGLKPEELRIFEVAGREVGDVYHECLMRLSSELTKEGTDITAENSPWMTITKEECDKRVENLMEELSGEYREGLLSSGEEERYRAARMKDVCSNAAWILIRHVQSGRIKEIYFEAGFGRSAENPFPPLEFQVGKQRLRIEGKIDRVDVMTTEKDGDDVSYVKIIDYKSGRERFDVGEARAGWRLQLMIYLQAAMEGLRPKAEQGTERTAANDFVKPAGVFYFEIAEPVIDGTKLSPAEYEEKIEKEIKKRFRLDGILVNNPEVIKSIAGDVTGASEIIPVKKSKEKGYVGTSEDRLLSESEFHELRGSVETVVAKMCGELAKGAIDIEPRKTKKDDACRFCRYRGICYFDQAFEGCRYRMIQ